MAPNKTIPLLGRVKSGRGGGGGNDICTMATMAINNLEVGQHQLCWGVTVSVAPPRCCDTHLLCESPSESHLQLVAQDLSKCQNRAQFQDKHCPSYHHCDHQRCLELLAEPIIIIFVTELFRLQIYILSNYQMSNQMMVNMKVSEDIRCEIG